MNKKFSTLMVLTLVVGSVSGQNWVTPTSNLDQGAYRTFETKSATSKPADNDALTDVDGSSLVTGAKWSKDVYSIDGSLWYQLEVKNTDTDWADVLVQERDTRTGKIYLRTLSKEDAPLNASLWKIVFKGGNGSSDGYSGGYYTFVNKETNLEIMFDHSIIANDYISELRAGIAEWAWYPKSSNGENKMDFQKVYSFLHNETDDVMYLAYEEDGDKSDFVDAAGLRGELLDKGFKRNVDVTNVKGGKLVKAKIKKDVTNTYLDNATANDMLQIKPVVASPFFMTAQHFNTRMDADDKTNDKTFEFNLTAVGTAAGKPLTGLAPFQGKFSAEDGTTKYAYGTKFQKDAAVNLQSTEGYKYFNLTFKNENGKYLMADTARYQESTMQPSASPAVMFNLKTPNEKVKDNAYMEARYFFRATYFPTNDSIVIEPMNAAVQQDSEYEVESWVDSKCCTEFFKNDYTVANSVVNTFENPTTKSKTVSLTTALIPGSEDNAITVARDNSKEFRLKVSINRPFAYLSRSTVATGLYWIKLANHTDRQRQKGQWIVKNMAGKMMYDTQAANQDYSLMPATMWMVEQLGCNEMSVDTAKYVRITNREYPGVVFEGQLYCQDKTATPKVYKFINRTGNYILGYDESADEGMFKDAVNQMLQVADELTFEEVTKEHAYTNHHGYKWFTEDQLNNGIENNYTIKLNSVRNNDIFLQSAKDEKCATVATPDDPTRYEIAEATWNATEGAIVKEFSAPLYKYNAAGTKSEVAPQLSRKAYIIKVKDANLIDNDRLYLASKKDTDGRYYYTAVKASELDNVDVKLGVFYLKADQNHLTESAVDDTCYVMVDINKPTATKIEGLKPLSSGYDLQFDNGWVKVAEESGSDMGLLRDLSLNDRPNDPSNAFYFESSIRNQYIDLATDYMMPLNNAMKIWRTAGTTYEYLYEDTNDKSGVSATTGQKVSESLGYLGIENKGVTTEHAAMYVDEVVASRNTYMPQYLLAVGVDSIPNGVACDDNQKHGYWKDSKEADATDCHYENYQGYTAGRFLVNLNDSIEYDNSHAMLGKASIYKYQGLTRLAFVEGVHVVTTAGEYLYIVNRGHSLKEAMTVKDNSGVSAESYIKKGYVLSWKKLAEIATKNELKKTTHSNYAFSLRKINDKADETAEASEGFLLESNDAENSAKVGGFTGAWVNVINNVPVLAQNSTKTEDHENASGDIQELINQAQVFHFGETDELPTDNKDVEVATIQVVAGNGIVTVKGAAGKNVVISNVLGQKIAATAISSDEATITVPAGIVFVAVEGEAAVKAIVK